EPPVEAFLGQAREQLQHRRCVRAERRPEPQCRAVSENDVDGARRIRGHHGYSRASAWSVPVALRPGERLFAYSVRDVGELAPERGGSPDARVGQEAAQDALVGGLEAEERLPLG